MMHFNFIASNELDLNNFKDVQKFVDSYPDFQTVTLKDENELKLLLELMGVNKIIDHELDNPGFSKYWDLSNFKLPEFTEEQFDQFYSNWIHQSKRENTMNEYGHLIFLQGLSSEWNKLTYRLIVKENN